MDSIRENGRARTTGIAGLIDDLEKLRELSPENMHLRIEEELSRVREGCLYLGVVGQFKRGKSSLVNALIEDDLLPTGILPVTSVVTLVRFGEPLSIDVVFEDGRRTAVSRADLPAFTTERGNPGNVKAVRYVDVRHPARFLSGGLVLIDTPGVGSLFASNSAVARAFVPRIDAAVFVLSADPPITETEDAYLAEILRHTQHVFFVLNKADMLTPREREESLAYLRSVLRARLPDGDPAVFPVTSRFSHGGGGENQGIHRLREELAGVSVKDGKNIVLDQAVRRFHALCRDAHFGYRLELRAMSMPIEQLRERMAAFENALSELARDRKRFRHLLSGETGDITRWIESQALVWKEKVTERLGRRLTAVASSLAHAPAADIQGKLAQTLAAELPVLFEEERREFEPILKRKYVEMVGWFATSLSERIERLKRETAELFDLPVEQTVPIPRPNWDISLTYKTEDDPLFLEIDIRRIGSRFLPRRLALRSALRAVMDRMERSVERASGNLRSLAVTELETSVRSFLKELDTRVDEVANGLEEAIRSAAVRRTEAEETIAPRLEDLRRRIRELDALCTG
ncbi:MAG: dynamin family protein [Bacteroidota bacterium]|nr:dynamin family protein [Bacteroidota bacterium]